MRHHLAVVVCLAFTGSVADAAPRRHDKVSKRKKKKVALPVELADDKRDDEDFVDEDEDDVEREDVEIETRVRRPAKPRAKDWHVAVGPYLWASSVDADVSLGSSTVSTGVDFFDIKRHAKYGAEVLAEASYGRFAFYGDLLWGVVGVNGDRMVGPLMVSLEGTASTLLADGLAGYRLAGDEHALASLEVRGGVRYQRTEIAGSLDVEGSDVQQSSYVTAAADALAGAHLDVRPHERFTVSGAMDLGVFGASDLTWSATADASIRITSHARFSLGWRTLTTHRTNVTIVMHGPRAALQLMF